MNRTITETKYQMFVQTIAELRKDNEKLRKALEFYADRDRYEPPISHIIDGEIYCNESEIEADFGRTAREALNKCPNKRS